VPARRCHCETGYPAPNLSGCAKFRSNPGRASRLVKPGDDPGRGAPEGEPADAAKRAAAHIVRFEQAFLKAGTDGSHSPETRPRRCNQRLCRGQTKSDVVTKRRSWPCFFIAVTQMFRCALRLRSSSISNGQRRDSSVNSTAGNFERRIDHQAGRTSGAARHGQFSMGDCRRPHRHDTA